MFSMITVYYFTQPHLTLLFKKTFHGHDGDGTFELNNKRNKALLEVA